MGKDQTFHQFCKLNFPRKYSCFALHFSDGGNKLEIHQLGCICQCISTFFSWYHDPFMVCILFANGLSLFRINYFFSYFNNPLTFGNKVPFINHYGTRNRKKIFKKSRSNCINNAIRNSHSLTLKIVSTLFWYCINMIGVVLSSL